MEEMQKQIDRHLRKHAMTDGVDKKGAHERRVLVLDAGHDLCYYFVFGVLCNTPKWAHC
jgi:hypothetical protein